MCESGTGWVLVFPTLTSTFKNRENLNPIPVKIGFSVKVGVGSGGYPWIRVPLPSLVEGR